MVFTVFKCGAATRRGAAYEARLALLFRSLQTADVVHLQWTNRSAHITLCLIQGVGAGRKKRWVD